MSNQLFDKSGGYRQLYSFTFATMIHLGTIRFCRKFVPYTEDPLGKTAGQMVGAARSGRQNIVEGSERSATSKETEIKLTDVSRASLGELLGDYEVFLAERGIIPWRKDAPDRVRLGNLRLPSFQYTDDPIHDYWVYFHEAREPFAEWLDSSDAVVVANAMIVLIIKTMAMLEGQMQSQGKVFAEQGGFRERMYHVRSAVRDDGMETGNEVPDCPECGSPMRRRVARGGRHAGHAFWGCSKYPECCGTRDAAEEGVGDSVTQ